MPLQHLLVSHFDFESIREQECLRWERSPRRQLLHRFEGKCRGGACPIDEPYTPALVAEQVPIAKLCKEGAAGSRRRFVGCGCLR